MKHLSMTEKLYDYLLDVSLKEHPSLRALREKTANHPLAGMQIAPEQAQFLQFLLKILKARTVLELGTFCGYSALAMALALPDDGQLITCDINEEWTKNAYPFWQEAKMDHKISLRLAPALQTLNALIADNYSHSFDFIFIDADKTNYEHYYEFALQLIKPSGVIAIDNIFWEGQVVDPSDQSGQTRAIRKLNAQLKQDERVDTALLPIADGLFLVSLRA